MAWIGPATPIRRHLTEGTASSTASNWPIISPLPSCRAPLMALVRRRAFLSLMAILRLLTGAKSPFPEHRSGSPTCRSFMRNMASPPAWDISTERIGWTRSEEHTSELQSLMRSSYAVFCLKKNKNKTNKQTHEQHKE